MPNVVVAENHLTYGGKGYFRGNAEEVEIGSVGEKRSPITKQNYLEVKDRIPAPKLKVVRSTIVEIDFKKTTKSSFGTKISAVVKGVTVKLDGSSSFERFKSGL